jgi:molecular chaperone DnaK
MGTDTRFPLGNASLLPQEVAAKVLQKLKSNAEKVLGVEVTEAVITVPAYFGDVPRRATEHAAKLAGIRPLRLISEPVAAAMAFGIDRMETEALTLVFDFGGGTLDVTIIDLQAGVLEVKGTDGDAKLGGKDMDDALMALMVSKAGFALPESTGKSYEALKREAERVKIALSSSQSVDAFIPAFAMIKEDLVDLELEVTREEFELAIKPILDRAMARIQGSLEKAGYLKSDVQKLLLVGGSCYVPAVRQLVEGYFDLMAEPGVDPDLAVGLGAAVSAGLKSGEIDSANSLVLQDSATHRLGTTVWSEVGGQMKLIFLELLPANAPIPWFKKERCSLMRLDQDVVEINVLEDVSGKAVFPEEKMETGTIGEIRDIPPSTTPEPRLLDISLEYDESHIVRVTGKIVGLDKELTLVLNSDVFKVNPLDVLTGSKVESPAWEQAPLAQKNTALIRRAEAVLSGNPVSGEMIEAALVDLKRFIAANLADQVQSTREKLTDLLADTV